MKRWLEAKLLLSREEINALELEGVKNARNLSEITAAMAWAQMWRERPWRGFLNDVLGAIAMVGAELVK